MNNYGDAYQGYNQGCNHSARELEELKDTVKELVETVSMLSSLVEALIKQPDGDTSKVLKLAAEIHIKKKG